MDHNQPTSLVGPLYPFEGKRPVVHPTAFVAPTAAVIGDVELGEGASVWYHCVLRGDTNFIRIGAAHQHPGRHHRPRQCRAAEPTIIGEDVTVGHAAIIHACTLEDRAFVGMGATVLDGAVIEEGGGAGRGQRAAAGQAHRPDGALDRQPGEARAGAGRGAAGQFDRTAPHYVELAGRHRASLAR